jgi:uncharacterized protein YdhG (YjbR/CyaY superfamily)
MAKRKEVDSWFKTYENPMKAVVQKVREIILAADPRIDECIKWQAPTFTYEGNMASFFPKSKQHASLMFHQGANIPGTHPRLEGDTASGRVLKLTSVEEATTAKQEIEAIVKSWCDWRDTTKTKPTAKKKTTTKTVATKAKAKAKTKTKTKTKKPTPTPKRATKKK